MPAPARPPRLLPACWRWSRGIRRRYGCVEAADVDTELEGVGAGDAKQLAFEELPLDLPALGRQVARPDRRGWPGRRLGCRR